MLPCFAEQTWLPQTHLKLLVLLSILFVLATNKCKKIKQNCFFKGNNLKTPRDVVDEAGYDTNDEGVWESLK